MCPCRSTRCGYSVFRVRRITVSSTTEPSANNNCSNFSLQSRITKSGRASSAWKCTEFAESYAIQNGIVVPTTCSVFLSTIIRDEFPFKRNSVSTSLRGTRANAVGGRYCRVGSKCFFFLRGSRTHQFENCIFNDLL